MYIPYTYNIIRFLPHPPSPPPHNRHIQNLFHPLLLLASPCGRPNEPLVALRDSQGRALHPLRQVACITFQVCVLDSSFSHIWSTAASGWHG